MTTADQIAVEAIEAAAWADLYAAAAPHLGFSTAQVAGATVLLAPAIPQGFFNRAIGLGVHQPAAEADLDAVGAVFRAAGAKSWWVHLAPAAQPAALSQWLQARGYAPAARKSWAKVLRGTDAPPDPETRLEVRPARPGEAQAVGETIVAAYGMPASFVPWFAAMANRVRWRGYLALSAGRAVGAALLFLDSTGAWLGAGGVLEAARGQHAHRALMALRVREAIAAGATRIATETGEPVGDEPNPSLANMAWCGFRQVSSRLNYALAA